MTNKTPVPLLAHDAMILEKYGVEVSLNGRLEREIIWRLCEHLSSKGFHVVSVDDGEGFNRHRIFLVLGNGRDIIADYGFYRDDRDGFEKAMEAFDVEAI